MIFFMATWPAPLQNCTRVPVAVDPRTAHLGVHFYGPAWVKVLRWGACLAARDMPYNQHKQESHGWLTQLSNAF